MVKGIILWTTCAGINVTGGINGLFSSSLWVSSECPCQRSIRVGDIVRFASEPPRLNVIQALWCLLNRAGHREDTPSLTLDAASLLSHFGNKALWKTFRGGEGKSGNDWGCDIHTQLIINIKYTSDSNVISKCIQRKNYYRTSALSYSNKNVIYNQHYAS